jgi:hypothetical protein
MKQKFQAKRNSETLIFLKRKIETIFFSEKKRKETKRNKKNSETKRNGTKTNLQGRETFILL